jgi:hypothetical protein
VVFSFFFPPVANLTRILFMSLNECNSLTDLANSALVLVKEKPITSIDDTNETANAVRQVLASVVYVVQASSEWNELVVEKTYDLVDLEPKDGFYKYHKPVGFIKVKQVDGIDVLSNDSVRIEGDYLFIKRWNAKGKYFKKNLNPSTWSDELKECVKLKLASQIATYLSNDFKLGTNLEERYDLFYKGTLLAQKDRRNYNAKPKPQHRSWIKSRKFR